MTFKINDTSIHPPLLWMLVALIVFITSLLIFEITRYSLSKRYDFPLSWVYTVLKTSQESMISDSNVGFDALMFLSFIKMCLLINIILLTINVPILIPIHYFNAPSNLNSSILLDTYSINSIPNQSPLLYIHVVTVFLTTISALIVIFHFTKSYISHLNQHILASTGLQQYTVMVENVPTNLLSEETFQQYFENLGIGNVEIALLDKIAGKKMASLISRRQDVLEKLEREYLQWTKSIQKFLKEGDETRLIVDSERIMKLRPRRVTLETSNLTHLTQDSIDFYTLKLKELTRQIKHERYIASLPNSESSFVETGFVIFETQKSALIASQIYCDDSMKITAAPAMNDMIWDNMSFARRWIQNMVVDFISIGLCLFTVSIASWINTTYLSIVYVTDSFFMYAFQTLGPNIILNIINMIIIPFILECNYTII